MDEPWTRTLPGNANAWKCGVGRGVGFWMTPLSRS